MNNEGGRVNFEAAMDTSQFQRSRQEVIHGFEQIGQSAVENGKQIDDMFKGVEQSVMKLAATIGLGMGLKEFANQVIETRGQFQQLNLAFETMLGSADKANVLFSELVDLAAKTPFDLLGVANGAKQLLAYGLAAEDVNETMRRLGDIAAGLSLPLSDMVYLFGTTMTQGRLFTRDIYQFQGRGIPLVDELAKKFGVAKNEIMEMTTAGKIGFEEVKEAIWNMTNEGGRFGGLMDKQATTVTGRLENVKDAIDVMFNKIGEANEGLIYSGIKFVGDLVNHWEDVVKVLRDVVLTYGVVKAAVMANAAITSALINQQIIQYQALLGTKKANLDADLAAKVSTGALTASKAQELQAIRAAIAAKIQEMQADLARARIVAANAAQEYKLALQKHLQAQGNMRLAQAQVRIALAGGNAEEIAAAKRGAAIAKLELQNAAIQKNNAHKAMNAAQTKRNALATELDTFQTKANAVAKGANTKATTLLTIANRGLKSALDSLKVAAATNPFTFWLSVISILVGAVMSLMDAFGGLGDEVDAVSEATEKAAQDIAETTNKLDSLFIMAEHTTKGTKAHEEAVDALCEIYEQYGIKIDDEQDKLGQLNQLRDEVIRKIKEEAEEKRKIALFSGYEDAIKQEIELLKKRLKEGYQNAEWEDSGDIDDWDAKEFQKRAEIISEIAAGIITSETEKLRELAKQGQLTPEELQNYVNNIKAQIRDAEEKMGLDKDIPEQEYLSSGGVVPYEKWIDVDYDAIITDYVTGINQLISARDDLSVSTRDNADASEEVAEAVDYEKMSFDELYNAAYGAEQQINAIDKSSAAPFFDTTSIDNLISQQQIAINNMLYLGGKIHGSYGFAFQNPINPSPFLPGGRVPKLNFSTSQFIGGSTNQWGIGFQPKIGNGSLLGPGVGTANRVIPAATSALEALNNRFNNARTHKEIDNLRKEIREAKQNVVAGSADDKRLDAMLSQLDARQGKGSHGKHGKGGSHGKHGKGGGHAENPEERKMAIEREEQSLNKLIEQQAEERRRLDEDLQMQEWQNRINLMEQGAEKVREQRNYDFKRDQIQLQRQRQQEIESEIARQKSLFDERERVKKAKDKKYVTKNFDEKDVDKTVIDQINAHYDALDKQAVERNKKVFKDQYLAEAQAMRDFLKEYGTYQQQKLAIAQDYAEKIKQATTEGERKRLEHERDAKIAEVGSKEIAMSIDWGVAFDGVGNVLGDIARETLKKVEDYMKTAEFKALDADKQKAYLDLRNNLRSEVGGDATSPFNFGIWGQIEQDVKAYQQSVRNLSDAQKAHEQAVNKLEQATKEEANATTDAEKAVAAFKKSLAQTEVESTAQSLKQAEGEKQTAQDNLTNSTKAAAQGIENFKNALSEMSDGSLYGFANGITKLVTSLTKGSDGVGKSLEQLGGKIGGIVGAILQILDALGDDPTKFVTDLIGKVDDVIDALLDQIANGQFITKILESVFQLVGNILQHAIADPVNAIAGLFGADKWLSWDNQDEVKDTITELTASNKALEFSIDRLTKVMEETAGAEATKAYETAKANLEQSQANTQTMMQAAAGEYKSGIFGIGGKHSAGYHIDKELSAADWQRISQITGKSVRNAGDFFNLTSEEMGKVAANAADLWGKIQKAAADGAHDVSEYMDEYIEYYDKLIELQNEYNETVTNISFDDAKSGLMDLLKSSTTGIADMNKQLNEYMRDAILNYLVNSPLKQSLQDWYSDFAAAMSDGVLTELEKQGLQDRYRQIYEKGVETRDAALAAAGLSLNDEYSQDSTKGGFATASQDSIDQLNGRFSAIQMSAVHIEEMMSTQIVNTTLVAAKISENSNRVSDIVNLMVICNSSLEAIVKNTKELYGIREDIASIKRNTDKL